MTKPIHVWFEVAREDGADVRGLVIEGAEWGPQRKRPYKVWWKTPGITGLPEPVVLDALVAGHALWAARLGQDLVIHGPMSRGGLYNLGELLALRRRLAPGLYPRLIEMRPESIITPHPSGDPNRAIAAVSSGLDSTFTVVRHALRLAGDASYAIDRLVMVHGFDVALERVDEFAEMRRRVEPLAAWLGLPLHTVVTNSKAIGGGMPWPHSAIPLTVAALSLFSSRCGVGLVSGATPDGAPRFSMAHPTMLDVLSSNDVFQVVSDGGGFGRAAKIESLLPYPVAIRCIKVCWSGSDMSRNCGRCQKCIMTRLNFLAAGEPDPSCFDGPLTTAMIDDLSMPSISRVLNLTQMCWNELRERGRKEPQVTALDRRLRRVPPDRNLLDLLLQKLPGRRVPDRDSPSPAEKPERR